MTNREAWLIAATAEISDIIGKHGVTVPTVRVSVGFPKGGRGNNGKAIGQCWPASAAADSAPQIFIHPSQSDSVRVLDILTHELIHAADGNKSGHKGEFARVAKAVGLTGKMTATVAGESLTVTLREIVGRLGEYPHAALTAASAGKKQTTRMLKCECDECGYTVRTTGKWLDLMGAPICPCNDRSMTIA